MVTDPLSASRLPDLPNAGYATLKQKQTSDAICEFMRQTERNRVLLLSIVVAFRVQVTAVIARVESVVRFPPAC